MDWDIIMNFSVLIERYFWHIPTGGFFFCLIGYRDINPQRWKPTFFLERRKYHSMDWVFFEIFEYSTCRERNGISVAPQRAKSNSTSNIETIPSSAFDGLKQFQNQYFSDSELPELALCTVLALSGGQNSRSTLLIHRKRHFWPPCPRKISISGEGFKKYMQEFAHFEPKKSKVLARFLQ